VTRYLLLLGSNVDREANLARAEAALAGRFEVLARSRVYDSEAVGDPGGPAFLNRALLLRSDLAPDALRRALHAVETALGRVRTAERNAPRTIDVDLLLAAEDRGGVLPEPTPHRDLARHHHAALPAAEIAGDLVLPGGGTLGALAASLGPPPRGFRAVTGPS
jgi:2-amino-4-hydroxy-6-hydroxymethyldihydropteridine diphosphokinase